MNSYPDFYFHPMPSTRPQEAHTFVPYQYVPYVNAVMSPYGNPAPNPPPLPQFLAPYELYAPPCMPSLTQATIPTVPPNTYAATGHACPSAGSPTYNFPHVAPEYGLQPHCVDQVAPIIPARQIQHRRRARSSPPASHAPPHIPFIPPHVVNDHHPRRARSSPPSSHVGDRQRNQRQGFLPAVLQRGRNVFAAVRSQASHLKCSAQNAEANIPRQRGRDRARAGRQIPAAHTFECKICLERCQKEDLAYAGGCRHAFCRECLREYVVTKIQEKIYPIVCPVCAADEQNDRHGVLDNSSIQKLGVPEHMFKQFVELQLSTLAVYLQCPRCGTSFYGDRGDIGDNGIVQCPSSHCLTVWCGKCNQIVRGDPTSHHCEGTRELDRLMKRRGWKYCPGCRTPAEKTEGCNHLTCPAPACNTHFCYSCGETIIRSTLRREIIHAVELHYSACRLYDDYEHVNVPVVV